MRSKRYLVVVWGRAGHGASGGITDPHTVRRGQFPGPRVRSEVFLAVNLKSWLTEVWLSNVAPNVNAVLGKPFGKWWVLDAEPPQ